MLSILQAQQKIAEAARAIAERETLSLRCARGRIAAVDCAAEVDVPPAANSAMDGYTFAVPNTPPPWHLPISQTVAAGSAPAPLAPGTAARIFTGANIPVGANTVAIQENCICEGAQVTVTTDSAEGANIRPQGQDFCRGVLLVRRGQVLRAPQLSLLAAGGIAEVDVVRAPRVAIINTGNELVEPGSPLSAGQIYNSNATMLRALCEGWGCEITAQLHAADSLEQSKQALLEVAGKVDLIITSGGVSVGDEDHVKNAVAALGQLELWKICMKPGKPLAFGFIHTPDKLQSTAIIGLPGNPVSSFVTALLFVKAFLYGLYGRPFQPPQPLWAPANFTIEASQKRPEFLRVQLQEHGLQPYPNQSSGVLSSLAWADALALIEPQRLPLQIGDAVPYYPLNQLLEL